MAVAFAWCQRSRVSAPAEVAGAPAAGAHPADDPPPADPMPSIAVLPFTLMGGQDVFSAIADAIPGELISTL